MQAMFAGLKKTLRRGLPILSRTIACNLPEGSIAKGLGEVQARYPSLEIGSYPSYQSQAGFNVSMVVRGVDEVLVSAAVNEVAELVRSLGDDPIEPS